MHWPEIKFPPIHLWTVPARMELLSELRDEATKHNVFVDYRAAIGKQTGRIKLVKPCGNVVTVKFDKPETRNTAINQAIELIYAMRSS